jgi:hypothetical protein
MNKFFEPKMSRETILFAIVFGIFIVGVLFGVRIAQNDAMVSNVAGSAIEY